MTAALPPGDWPLVEHSRIVASRPHRWHVQQVGEGPDLLLLHGAGASTHSWRGMVPHLAKSFRLTLIDLPGHGWTQLGSSGRSGLDPMAEDVGTLLNTLDLKPSAIIGHSAGAAVALRLAMDTRLPVVSINGAFQMFEGIAGFLFPLMAKVMAVNPLTVPLFTAASSPARTRRLLEGTGSTFDEESLRLYHTLVSKRSHVSGALTMMANWSLDRLVRDAPGLDAPVLLLTGGQDGLVPPDVSRDMARRLPMAMQEHHPELGHLMHEEAPDLVAGACLKFLATCRPEHSASP